MDITVVIADDHAVLRRGLRELIEEEAGVAVVAEAANGREAVEKILALQPTIAVLDIDMPVQSGLDAARELGEGASKTLLVALSMHDEEKIFDRAMDLGFRGFILKDGAPDDIVAAIRAVAAGKFYVSPVLSGFALTRAEKAAPVPPSAGVLLTQTELKVLRLISESKSTKEIAEALFVSPRTIDSHRANIAQKLGLKGPNALLRYALEKKGRV